MRRIVSRRLRRWMWRMLGVLCLLWLFAPGAWAGDCSGETDCGAPRDNAPKAAGGAAIATAIGLALRGSNGNGGSDGEEADGGDDGSQPPPKPKKKEDEGSSVASTPDQALGGGGDAGGGPAGPGPSRPDPGALGE